MKPASIWTLRFLYSLGVGMLSLSVLSLVLKGVAKPTPKREIVSAEAPGKKQLTAAAPTAPAISLIEQAQGTTLTPDTIVLGSRNTLALRGEVTPMSMAKLQTELLAMSNRLNDSDVIYLVLDTPGGSVEAGANFIDLAKGIPQQIKTITVFSASMGFHIAQNMGERLIIPSGTLMSHHAQVSGIGGEAPGNMITRVNFLVRKFDIMDSAAGARMGLDLPAYREKIKFEYWTMGTDAVADKAADRVVLVRCAPDMMDSEVLEEETMFGKVHITVSKCPVITGALAIDTKEMVFPTDKDRSDFERYENLLRTDKRQFVKDFIVTNEFERILKLK